MSGIPMDLRRSPAQAALALAAGWARVASGRGPKEATACAAELARLSQLLCALHRLDIRCAGHPPAPGAVLVSNHLGYLDPLVLCALCACSPVAKVEVSSWLAIGGLTRRLNVNFVHRESIPGRARTLLRALRTLQGGVSVLNFPEGTTSRGALLPFHRGAFWLSRRAGRPLVPIVMRFNDPRSCWVDREQLLPHYLRLLTRRDRTLHVRFLPALDPRDYASADALAAAARMAILRGLQQA